MASAAAWFTVALRSPGSVKYLGDVVYQLIAVPYGQKNGGPLTHLGPAAIPGNATSSSIAIATTAPQPRRHLRAAPLARKPFTPCPLPQ